MEKQDRGESCLRGTATFAVMLGISSRTMTTCKPLALLFQPQLALELKLPHMSNYNLGKHYFKYLDQHS